jgi:hypothetical protein
MSDLDLRELRDHVDATVQTPSFDDVLARGARRRRARLGLALATILVVGIGVVIDQHLVEARGSGSVRPVPEDKSAGQIIDDPQSTIEYVKPLPGGHRAGAWVDDCDKPPCNVAVGWSDDGWSSRTTAIVPPEADYELTRAGLVVMPWKALPYVVHTDGTTVQVRPPGPPAPLGGGEIVVSQEVRAPAWLYVDPQTGDSHRVVAPPGMTVDDITAFETGTLRAIGHDPYEGTWVIATSSDGGATWDQSIIPAPWLQGDFGQDARHILLIELGGLGYVSSSDGGATWSDVRKLPFPIRKLPFPLTSSCSTVVSGANLLTSNGELWSTSNDAWTRFERITDTPELSCIESDGELVTGWTNDGTVYDSADRGRTWTEIKIG